MEMKLKLKEEELKVLNDKYHKGIAHWKEMERRATSAEVYLVY